MGYFISTFFISTALLFLSPLAHSHALLSSYSPGSTHSHSNGSPFRTEASRGHHSLIGSRLLSPSSSSSPQLAFLTPHITSLLSTDSNVLSSPLRTAALQSPIKHNKSPSSFSSLVKDVGVSTSSYSARHPSRNVALASSSSHDTVEGGSAIAQSSTQWRGARSWSLSLHDAVKPIMDVEHIKTVLPHRYPFLLVDKVIDFKPGEKNYWR